jgi:hypothetical protein
VLFVGKSQEKTPVFRTEKRWSPKTGQPKENRALRSETTINNTYDFGIGKRLHNLPKLREIGFAANRQLLDVECLSHDCMLAEETFQALNAQVAAGQQRASGLRFADVRGHSLLHALILFR